VPASVPFGDVSKPPLQPYPPDLPDHPEEPDLEAGLTDGRRAERRLGEPQARPRLGRLTTLRASAPRS
jgi:hypothetical protein